MKNDEYNYKKIGIKIPPTFKQDLAPVYLTSDIVSYTLPEIVEVNNLDFTIYVKGLDETWQKYNPELRKFTFDKNLAVSEIKNTVLQIKIMDSEGTSSEYELYVLKSREFTIADFNSTFTNKTTDNKVEILNNTQNETHSKFVHARIESISGLGLMKIKFTEQMRTNINLTIIDKEVLNIYMEPSKDRE